VRNLILQEILKSPLFLQIQMNESKSIYLGRGELKTNERLQASRGLNEAKIECPEHITECFHLVVKASKLISSQSKLVQSQKH